MNPGHDSKARVAHNPPDAATGITSPCRFRPPRRGPAVVPMVLRPARERITLVRMTVSSSRRRSHLALIDAAITLDEALNTAAR